MRNKSCEFWHNRIWRVQVEHISEKMIMSCSHSVWEKGWTGMTEAQEQDIPTQRKTVSNTETCCSRWACVLFQKQSTANFNEEKTRSWCARKREKHQSWAYFSVSVRSEGKKKNCRQQESSWLAACFSQVLLLQLLNKLTQHTQALGRVLKYYPPLSHSPST